MNVRSSRRINEPCRDCDRTQLPRHTTLWINFLGLFYLTIFRNTFCWSWITFRGILYAAFSEILLSNLKHILLLFYNFFLDVSMSLFSYLIEITYDTIHPLSINFCLNSSRQLFSEILWANFTTFHALSFCIFLMFLFYAENLNP